MLRPPCPRTNPDEEVAIDAEVPGECAHECPGDLGQARMQNQGRRTEGLVREARGVGAVPAEIAHGEALLRIRGRVRVAGEVDGRDRSSRSHPRSSWRAGQAVSAARSSSESPVRLPRGM